MPKYMPFGHSDYHHHYHHAAQRVSGAIIAPPPTPTDPVAGTKATLYTGTPPFGIGTALPEGNFDTSNPGYTAQGKAIISMWLRPTGTAGNNQRIFSSSDDGSARFAIIWRSNSQFRIEAKGQGGSVQWRGNTSSVETPRTNNWNHFLISIDVSSTNDSERFVQLYMSDVPTTLSYNTDPITLNSNILGLRASGVNGYGLFAGSANDGGVTSGNVFHGDVSEFYFIADSLDMSVESNRRKFISSAGMPVYLGSDGSTPTGNQPLIYLPTGRLPNLGQFTGAGALSEYGTLTDTTGPNG